MENYNTENQRSGVVNTTKTVVKTVKIAKILLGLLNLKTLAVALIILFIVMMIGVLASSTPKNTGQSAVSTQNLSETTLRWLSAVESEAEKQGVPELVPYIMAIIEVESRGVGNDIMQSSESVGLGPNGFSDPLQSIEQGVRYLKSSVAAGEALGFTDFWAVVQSYNFGTAYVTYLATRNKKHSFEVAEDYSRTVVAPSLGNTTGAKRNYVNAVSQAHGKTYIYANGGNFYYAELVRQYVSIGSSEIPLGDEVFQTVMQEVLKYEGWSYSWGGMNPQQGFDCSGLMQYSFAKAGISLPRVARDQWAVTEKIDIKDAQPGDLIFFKGTYGGPNHISHVGIYIDETRMYDSNGSGIGYHYWTDPYWSKHFESIRRIVR